MANDNRVCRKVPSQNYDWISKNSKYDDISKKHTNSHKNPKKYVKNQKIMKFMISVSGPL